MFKVRLQALTSTFGNGDRPWSHTVLSHQGLTPWK
jgi:hypothetical protein